MHFQQAACFSPSMGVCLALLGFPEPPLKYQDPDLPESSVMGCEK